LIKAQAAIYVNQGVESAFVLDVEKCASHVAGLTASMAALPFKHPPSRLSCVRKLKVSFKIYIYICDFECIITELYTYFDAIIIKARASLQAIPASESESQGGGGGGGGSLLSFEDDEEGMTSASAGPAVVSRSPAWARNVWLRQLMSIPRVSEAKVNMIYY